MSIAVIQGSSSGLGLALTRHILQHTNLSVYALTHQKSASSVKESIMSSDTSSRSGGLHSRLTVVERVDVKEEDGLERAAKVVREREGAGSVRAVVCLAGVLHLEKSLSTIDADTALDSFRINTLGHLLTYKHFVPLIPSKREFQKLRSRWGSGEEVEDPAKGLVAEENSVCCSLSARVGSIGDNRRGGWYSYRATKAALNQVVRTLNHELINRSSSAVAYGYHPGTVLTSFTSPIIGSPSPDPANGRFAVDGAIEHLVSVMRRVRRDTESGDGSEQWGGQCWDWRGERIEW